MMDVFHYLMERLCSSLMKPLQPKVAESPQTLINSQAEPQISGVTLQETHRETWQMELGALEQGRDGEGVML